MNNTLLTKMRLAAPVAFLALACGVPAHAEPVSSVSVNYNIDVGPMTMTVVRYRLQLSEGALRSNVQIKSHGISRVFSEYTAKAEAESLAKGKSIAPVRFHLVREKEDNKREAKLEWRDGAIDYAPKEKKPERRARIDDALNAKIADPMTAVLRIGTTGESPCPSVQQVFDGRDIFELKLTDKGMDKMDDDEGYSGPVRRCVVTWTPIAGRAVEKNIPSDSYDVAFAPVGELPSGRTLWLPVSMSGSLKGLGFKAYATKFKTEGAGSSTASGQ